METKRQELEKRIAELRAKKAGAGDALTALYAAGFALYDNTPLGLIVAEYGGVGEQLAAAERELAELDAQENAILAAGTFVTKDDDPFAGNYKPEPENTNG